MQVGKLEGVRKRIVLAVVAILVIAAILLFPSGEKIPIQPEVSLTFKGQQTGTAYRAAGFDVTNTGRIAILLAAVRVQVWMDGKWIEWWKPHFIKTNASSFPSVLEPGEGKRISVEWPEDAPWRVELICHREAVGVSGVFVKARSVWERGTKILTTNRVWIASGSVLSSEITSK